MEKQNPFVVIGYRDPEAFCDRHTELQLLDEAVSNQRNMTLFAPRRIGKTGLIMHYFHNLSGQSSWLPIYLDVLPSLTALDLITRLGNTLLEVLSREKNTLRKILEALSSLRPRITIDPVTGAPSLEIDSHNTSQIPAGIHNLFAYLKGSKKKIIIALDEFQQITAFEDLNMEALIRSIMQQHANIRFIFSGSRKQMLLSMFTEKNRPFYQSTQLLNLLPLPEEEYQSFIKERFTRYKRRIDNEVIKYILEITQKQTYYSQLICNRLFSDKSISKIEKSDVTKVLDTLLSENQLVYFNYRNLLTRSQWKLLKSLAHAGKIYQPTGQDFIMKYNLGTPSSVSRSLFSLIDKEMVIIQNDFENRPYYEVEDALFALWLSRH